MIMEYDVCAKSKLDQAAMTDFLRFAIRQRYEGKLVTVRSITLIDQPPALFIQLTLRLQIFLDRMKDAIDKLPAFFG